MKVEKRKNTKKIKKLRDINKNLDKTVRDAGLSLNQTLQGIDKYCLDDECYSKTEFGLFGAGMLVFGFVIGLLMIHCLSYKHSYMRSHHKDSNQNLCVAQSYVAEIDLNKEFEKSFQRQNSSKNPIENTIANIFECNHSVPNDRESMCSVRVSTEKRPETSYAFPVPAEIITNFQSTSQQKSKPKPGVIESDNVIKKYLETDF